MAKVILICGTICSGKTTYAEAIRAREKAVILSCDELMLSLFDPLLGERHDEIAARARTYLIGLAMKLTEAGTNVILDWGFWTREARREMSGFFEERNIPFEWHFIRLSDEQWMRNIEKRNMAVLAGKVQAYYVDDGLLNKVRSRFEAPDEAEMSGSVQNMHPFREINVRICRNVTRK